MTYILVGPGLRDNVPLENLFPMRTVEQLSPVKRVEELDRPVTEGTQGGGGTSGYARQAQHAYREAAEPPHEREKAVYAAQIMTRNVITISDDMSLSQAWGVLEEHEFRHLPVVAKGDGMLVGMVTEHDFIISATSIGGLPPLAESEAEIRTAAQLMSSPILSATTDTDIHELAGVMYERHIGAVPILDNSGELTGIITHRDILKALVKPEPLELWI